METQRFDIVARSLHWIMAILILLMMFGGLGLEDLTPQARAEPLKAHSGIGLILLFLVVVRLWWRRRHPAPPYPPSMSPRQQKIAKAVVHAIYALMIFQPIVGLIHAATHVTTTVSPFGLINLTSLVPSDAAVTGIFHVLHGIGFFLLALLVLGHLGAALKHWLIDKDVILSRMTPFVRPPS